MVYLFPFFGDIYTARLRKVQLKCTCIALDIYNRYTQKFEEWNLLTENVDSHKNDHVYLSKTIDNETKYFVEEQLIRTRKMTKTRSCGSFDEFKLSKEFVNELEGKPMTGNSYENKPVKEGRKSHERAIVHDKRCSRIVRLDTNPRHW